MSEQDQIVFIVDDDEDIRSSLSRALTKRGYNVKSFESADVFLNAYDPDQSGCLVLDYGMPGMNGLQLQERLAQKDYLLPIIFITGHGGVPESVQAIKAGAIDFLEKPFRQSLLLEHIDAALKEDQKARASRARMNSVHARVDTLTKREWEIAHMMAQDSSNTSSKQIGLSLNISPRTVDHHRARILEKMQVASVAELVHLLITAGLVSK
ncbi:DNA-binding response regulator [Tateyamaria omphalii]|uniref:response regulator transcription factor n=1 Tax=Tateyamaria omphalii TaxID=299262 RepID=UPI001677BA83|nr:response regulator [Tateyamaria omphalii]GGX60397.1 DNA-binding response regulator [Tateyamaria omphalii]